MKKIFRYAAATVLILICSVVIGIALMTVVYMLPTDGTMKKNASAISDTYKRDGTYPMWADGYLSAREDNFTDATMLLIAVNQRSGNALYDAMLNEYRVSPDSKLGREQSLNYVCNNEDGSYLTEQYGRYWHGYLLWMKPLLLIFSANTIKMIGCFFDLFLGFSALIMVKEKLGVKNMWALYIVLMMLNPITIGMSFQFKSVYEITMISLIFIVSQYDWICLKKNIFYMFMIVGIIVAFFDLLTYPLVSLGFPIIVLIGLGEKSGKYVSLKQVAEYSMAWVVGYLGMWIGKWIAGTVITKQNIVYDAITQIGIRTSHSNNYTGKSIALWNTWYNNICVIVKWPYVIMVGIFLIFLLISMVKNKNIKNNMAQRTVIELLSVAVLPFLWMAMMRNHSYIHCFFVYRIITVTVYAVLVLIMNMGEKPMSEDSRQAVDKM